ncbi:MAG: BamA/TamA family outer membrane protein [Planctomycetota bacterium]
MSLLATLLIVLAPRAQVGGQGAPERDRHDTGRAQHYDPRRGLDANGRIPNDSKPQDLPHRERWRYVPEGRLKPGSLLERFLVSSFISPIVFHEQDVGTGGGVAITDVDFRNKRRQEFANMVFTYTTEGQQNYTVLWRRWPNHREVDGGGVVFDERTFVSARAGYSRTLTRRFFGLGDRTRPIDESSYTQEVSEVSLFQQWAVREPADDLLLRLGAALEHHNLARGRVSTVPSTDDRYPELFRGGDDQDILWLTLGTGYDTRDSQHNPYGGWTVDGRVDAAVQTGGDLGAIATFSSSKVIAVPPLLHDGGDPGEEHPPTDTLAVGGFVQTTLGDLPFFALPTLGGTHTLRGFVPGRFTGEHAWHAGVEYRFWGVPRGFKITEALRIERLGAALFYDIGSITVGSFGDLFDAEIKQSYGVGFRMSLERSALFRIDLGWSDEDFNFTIGYGLSF